MPQTRSSPTIHALVVDDNSVNRKMLCALCATMGIATQSAVNGLAAVKAFAEDRFDVVLMDCRMPIMDGLEATRALRASEAPGCRVPVLAVTASQPGRHADARREAGMDGLVRKPIRVEELVAALAAVGIELPAPARPAQVVPEPEIALTPELLDLFATEAGSYLEKLATAMAGGDVAECISAAHALKGMAMMLRLEELVRGARSVEVRCRATSRPPQPEALADLRGRVEDAV
ncbi:MAG: response regulator, partial [Armatimonadetes bacterium]|nr:response regulator [Armatimonadota bacterium]